MSDDSRLKLAAFNIGAGAWNLRSGLEVAADGRPILASLLLIVGAAGLFAGIMGLRR